ncbi:hypothetical protein D3C76_910700 [compost metagenome]
MAMNGTQWILYPVTKVMKATTATDAPPVTPSRSGEARGLRMTPCNSAPATANAAPMSIAATIRGKRNCIMIRLLASAFRPVREASTSFNGTLTPPTDKLRSDKAATIQVKPKNNKNECFAIRALSMLFPPSHMDQKGNADNRRCDTNRNFSGFQNKARC